MDTVCIKLKSPWAKSKWLCW